MKRYILTALALLLVFLLHATSAAAETVFGPEEYVRTKGAADVYVDTFPATPGPGRITVLNGTAAGEFRVSSAAVVLNGEEIFGTERFSDGTYILEAPVALADKNTLTVTIKKAKGGCYLTVEITRGGVEPPTVTMGADPDTIQPGESSTLSWTSTNADSCEIHPGVGPVDVSGSMSVSPMVTTTYTITATGPGGTALDNVTIRVDSGYPPPTVSLQADPHTVLPCEASTLSWTSTDADSCTIEPDVGTFGPDGSVTVSPTRTTTYTITARGPAGTATDSVVIAVLISEETVFGPEPYVRYFVPGNMPNDYRDEFNATGTGRIIVTNGDADGTNRLDDAIVEFNHAQIFGPGDFSKGVHILEAPVTFNEHGYNYLDIELIKGKAGTYIAVEVIKQEDPPEVSLNANHPVIVPGESSTLSWTSTHVDSCSIEPGIGPVDPNGSIEIEPEETTTYTISACGPGGGDTESVTVTLAVRPKVSLTAGFEAVLPGESSTLSWTSSHADSCVIDPDIGPVGLSGSIDVFPSATTMYTITATGVGGTIRDTARVGVTGAPEPQPEGSFGQAYEDLIPPDTTTASYDADRFAVITGRVQHPDRSPIADVSIRILTLHGLSDYGTVLTDADGRFAIPVEGGSTMTVVFEKDGLLTAHRRVDVPWNDLVVTETVEMIAQDPAFTFVTFDGNPHTSFTHESTPVSDESGTRSCSMVFTGDNHAYEVDAEGNMIREITTFTARATEYSTPDSMPARLPPVSGYTYCVELAVDGVERVRFDRPVITWVDNFLDFDVGEVVPAGYYDRHRAAWVPMDNGVVVELLDTDFDGIVDALDADGDGVKDDLNENGSLRDEVTGLQDLVRYQPGTTFWRVEISHFTAVDYNWPYRCEDGQECIDPNPEGQAGIDHSKCEHEDCLKHLASFVEERSRVLHEDIPIPGTDMTLHYASSRLPSYKKFITVPASGATVPAALKRIIVRVSIAGQVLERTLPPLPGQTVELEWDGLDGLGRMVNRPTTAHLGVGFVYDAVYKSPAEFLATAFANPGDNVTAITAREELVYWKESLLHIPKTHHQGTVADGWTLSVQHHLSPLDASVLLKGDGTMIENDAVVIKTVAGTGVAGPVGDGGPASEANLYYPGGLVLDAEGNYYIADRANARVRKVDGNGIISTVAGNGNPGYFGDGGLAVEAEFMWPGTLCFDNAGNLYITDLDDNRVRKVDPNGIISTVAGDGTEGDGGDGGSAIQAQLNYPHGIALDNEGNLYIADSQNHRIRKVDTNGIISTVAGTGEWGFSGDGGPAVDAQLNSAGDVAFDAGGNLYISDYSNHRIRKVDTAGILTTVAGNGTQGHSGDGGPAIEAQLSNPVALSFDPAGNLYVADWGNHCIRRIDTSGNISTVAGTGIMGYAGDGGPPTKADLYNPIDVAVDAKGNFYVVDFYNHNVREIAAPRVLDETGAEGDIPFTESSGVGHELTGSGRHEKTFDLETGVVLLDFGYNDQEQLISVTDTFGNQVTIQRVSGVPVSITSPCGLVTLLNIDPDNTLKRITYPDGSFYEFEYDNGLLTAKVEPRGNRFDHGFDPVTGRVEDVRDQEGGHWRFSRTVDQNGDAVSQTLSAEGNATSYSDHNHSTGAYSSAITDPTGAQTLFRRSADGLTANKSLPCGMDLSFQYQIDPEYHFKYVSEVIETTPQGLDRVIAGDKIYHDTDQDGTPDLITHTVTVNGKPTTLIHDVLQAQKTLTSPENRNITILYDPVTLLTTNLMVPDLHETVFGYDTGGRLTSIVMNTRQTTFSYNARGFLESITDPENRATTYDYDNVGRMEAIHRPDTSTLRFDYDMNGNMTVLTNPSSVSHGFGYNNVNRNCSYRTPLSGTYSYMYDKDRRLVQTNFPSGRQINNLYDNIRLVRIQTPEGNIDFTHLCGTKVDAITNGLESITYGYDGRLVTSELFSGTLNQTLSYDYYDDFSLQSFFYAGASTAYVYDHDGLLTDAGPFAISRNRANGLPETIEDGVLNVSQSFDGYAEMDSQDFSVAGQSLFSWDILDRYADGKIKHKAETIEGVTSIYLYTYDAMGRLTTVTIDGVLAEEYQYDPDGTRNYGMNALRGIPGRTFSYSDEDHLLTAGTVAYDYDLDGFLTTRTDGSDVTRYNYSSRGELLGVTLPDGTLIEYVHDPLGRRIAKKADGGITEKYLWQGLTRLLAICDENDNLLMRFEYADGRVPFAMSKGGALYYLNYDQVGSLRVVADRLGNVVKRIDYDSFGNIISDTNTSFSVPLGFAGGLHDQNIRLVRFGNRDYDPGSGRWTAKDPILFGGGDTDLYGYCVNDPVNLVDPKGLWGSKVHRELTRTAMENAGFSDSDIKAANLSNVLVDARPFDDVAHYMPGTGYEAENLIRETMDMAVAKESEGQHVIAMALLGEALHTAQDKWAHDMQDAGWWEHVPIIGIDPDNPDKHPFEYAMALQDTMALLLEFRARACR